MPQGNDTLCLGAISGTSVDGLDLALLEINEAPETVTFVCSHTTPIPQPLRVALLNLGQKIDDDVDHLGRADRALGQFIGEAINAFLKRHDVAPQTIDAIGSHGQTIRHRPEGPEAFTLQIGDPNRIAEVTGITTVADFRRRDMAAGGQGAPLVPPFHEVLFRQADEACVVLNIGGISNVTLLPARGAGPISGYDTGPGNALMDAWIAHHKGQPYDADGAWGASGTLHNDLLAALLTDPYLALPPPKSTGREHYHLEWLDHQIANLQPISSEDVQATLVAFTATSVIQAVARWEHQPGRILVCGGGRHNPLLMQALATRAIYPVINVDDQGVDGDAIEAAAFAWLANQTLRGQPGSAPGVTGAIGARVLGAIYPA